MNVLYIEMKLKNVKGQNVGTLSTEHSQDLRLQWKGSKRLDVLSKYSIEISVGRAGRRKLVFVLGPEDLGGLFARTVTLGYQAL